MRPLFAFIKKEVTEHIRTGKLVFLLILFVLFGIMNPAIAKLTPWLLETLSDSLAESGMMVTDVTVSAMDSWVQFFKNIPMALIVFVLLESGIFTREYETGTLVLSLTKGLERYKVVISKTFVLAVLWSFFYWMCFCITYGYNAYFWDNSVAENLMLSVFNWWLFGIWIIALTVLFSTISTSSTGVTIGVGVVFIAVYLCSLYPKFSQYMPTFLMDGNSLIYGVEKAEAYIESIAITAAISVVMLLISIPIFNKKQL